MIEEPTTPDMGLPFASRDLDPQLTVRAERVGTTVLVTLRGELDAATEPLLMAQVERQLDESCQDLIVSCKDLTFVDSSGLRALLSVRACCAGTDTRFQLVHTNPQLDRLLEITGLSRAFQ